MLMMVMLIYTSINSHFKLINYDEMILTNNNNSDDDESHHHQQLQQQLQHQQSQSLLLSLSGSRSSSHTLLQSVIPTSLDRSSPTLTLTPIIKDTQVK